MPQQKIPDLPVASDIANEDVLYVVDTSDTTESADGSSKHITWAMIIAAFLSAMESRIGTVASTGSLTINTDDYDVYTVTALAAGMTINAPTGDLLYSGKKLTLRIKDNGTARALTFNGIFRFSSDLSAPTTTVVNKTMYLGFMYNDEDSKWDCIAKLNNF